MKKQIDKIVNDQRGSLVVEMALTMAMIAIFAVVVYVFLPIYILTDHPFITQLEQAIDLASTIPML